MSYFDMASLIQKIRPEDFLEEVASETRTVLLLCMPHDDAFPQQRRIIEEVAGMFREELKVVLAEESCIEVFKRDFHISGTPTFLILCRGIEMARILGVTDRESLIRIIRENVT